MSNYYVRRTGDNSDYLMHAAIEGAGSGGKRGWKNHLYKLKMMVNGKMRYFYDNASIAAARAGHNVGRAIGIEQRNSLQRLNKAAGKRMGRASVKEQTDLAKAVARSRNSYNKTLLGRIENTGNAARKLVGDAATKARKSGQNFVGSISKNAYNVASGALKSADKAIGISARKTVEKSKRDAEGAKKVYGISRRSGQVKADTVSKLRENYQNKKKVSGLAENYYKHNTLLGRAESMVDDASDWVKRQKRIAKHKTKKAKQKVKRASFDAYLATRPKGKA